jgi:hypothetical protein
MFLMTPTLKTSDMKKILTLVFLFLLMAPAFAQEDDNTGELQQDPNARQRIKAAHAAYITERLALTPEEAEKFWPVYDEFIKKRVDLKLQMREAKRNGQNDQQLLDLDLKIKQQELDLEKEYSGRLQKIISPQKLLNLRQAEKDFRKLLLQRIQQRQQLRERRMQRSPRNN